MTLATLGPRGVQKPPPGTPIDWGDPYARALFSAITFDDPCAYDATVAKNYPISDRAATAPATLTTIVSALPTIVSGPHGGPAWSNPYNGTGGGSVAVNGITTARALPSTVGGLTVLAIVREDATSNSGNSRWICSTASTNGVPLILSAVSGAITTPRFLVNGTTASGAAGLIVAAQWAVWVGTWDGHTILLYKNGQQVASASVSSLGTAAGSAIRFCSDGSGDALATSYDAGYVWLRALGPAEVAGISARPFRFFQQPFVLRLAGIGVPTSGGASGTLAFAAGGATLALAGASTSGVLSFAAGSATLSLNGTGPTPTTQTYTSSNLSLDSNSALYGGWNLRTVGGVVQLAHNRPAVDATHHVLYSRMENGSGTTVTDDSTEANGGSLLTGGSNTDDPKWDNGAGARFNATGYYQAGGSGGDSIDCGVIADWEYTQPFYLWQPIQMTSGHAPPAGGAAIIYTRSYGSPYTGHELWIDENGKLRTRFINNFGGGAYFDAQGSTNLVDGVQHIIGMTYDGSGHASGVQFYVDGVAETMTVVNDALGGNTIVNSSNHFWIGNQNGWPYSFPGRLGPLRLLTGTAPTGFFTTTYKTATPPATLANTYVAYDFSETSGVTIYDQSGNGRNGAATDNRVLAAFKVGDDALFFNGTGDYDQINYPAISAYNLSTTLTFMAWLNVYSTGNGAALLKYYPDAGSVGYGLMLNWSNGHVQWWDGTAFDDTGYTITTGWHCVAVRYGKTAGTCELWIDGTSVASFAASTPASTTSALLLGNWVGEMNALLSLAHLRNDAVADSYLTQFSKAKPASGVASLSSPSTAVASGGGDYGSSQTFTNLAAAFTTPTTTGLKFRVAASNVSAADATTQKQALGWTALSASNTISITGRWLDFDIEFLPSTDTLARDTPTLSSVTLTYTAAATPSPQPHSLILTQAVNRAATF